MATMKEIEKFLEQVGDKTNISFNISVNGRSAEENGYVIEGEYWSDLGEDVLITLVIDELSTEEILHAMYLYEESFDAEDHATELYNLHGQGGTPTSLRALLNDADEQQKKLEEIYEVMRDIVRN
jgi:hypothetical protein